SGFTNFDTPVMTGPPRTRFFRLRVPSPFAYFAMIRLLAHPRHAPILPEPLLETNTNARGINQTPLANELHYFYKRNLAVDTTQPSPSRFDCGFHLFAIPADPTCGRGGDPRLRAELECTLTSGHEGLIHPLELLARPQTAAGVHFFIKERAE